MLRNRSSAFLYAIIFLIIGILIGNFFISKQSPADSANVSKNQHQLTSKAPVPKKNPTIGVLQLTSHPALDLIYKGIQAGLKDNGYEDGIKANIVFQNGQGDQSKLNTMSQRLIQQKSDILIGIATPACQALANNTKDIPIILGAVSNPERSGLVQSNQKPGGNITGVSDQSPVADQYRLMQQLIPDVKKVGILISFGEDNSKYQAKIAKKAGEKLGLTVDVKSVPSSNEIAQMVQQMSKYDVIYIPNDNTIANAMQAVVNEANKTKTPVFPVVDTMVEQGGIATVGVDQFQLGYKTGEMAAAVLKGKSEPATTPVYVFKKGTPIINESQMEKLGLSIPAKLKTQAKIVK